MAEEVNGGPSEPEAPEAPPEDQTPPVERRKQPRFLPREAHCTYRKGGLIGIFGGRESPDFAQPIIDVSKSGINFATNEKMFPKTKLKMKIHLSKETPAFEVEGRVVWTGKGRGDYKYCAGVQFTKFGQMAWKYLSKLRAHIKERTVGSQSGIFTQSQLKKQG
jgi:hypothetical protein